MAMSVLSPSGSRGFGNNCYRYDYTATSASHITNHLNTQFLKKCSNGQLVIYLHKYGYIYASS